MSWHPNLTHYSGTNQVDYGTKFTYFGFLTNSFATHSTSMLRDRSSFKPRAMA